MKKYRILTAIFLIIFIGGGWFHFQREHQTKAENTLKDPGLLSIVLPGAQSFSERGGTPPHYQGYKTSAQTESDFVGLAFVTTDITPDIRGYAGPIKMLVGMTPDGVITKTHLLDDSETPTYIRDLDTFLDQFASKKITDPFELNQDLDGISRATITSNAIARAVRKSGSMVAAKNLRLTIPATTVEQKPFPWKEIIVPFLLFGLAVLSILKRKRILRRAALCGGFLYFGVMKSTMVSVVIIANICLLRLPDFYQNPLWYALTGLTIMTTLLFGMVFCGSLCPFAAVQEFLYSTTHRGKKLQKHSLSPEIDYGARTIKYCLLFAVILTSVILGNTNIASLEPFLTLFSRNGTTLAWSLVALTLAASLFYFRFWCKYFCPVGACLGLLARISPFKIRLGQGCTHCAACEKVCPTRAIHINKQELPEINYSECILCNKCTDICPKQTLHLKGFSHEE